MSATLLAVLPMRAAWLQRRDPRLRILLTLGFALVVVSLRDIPVLLASLAAVAGLAYAAGLAWAALWRRLLPLQLFVLMLLLVLPWTVPGTVLLQLGPLAATEQGLLQVLRLALRANAVVGMALLLLGTLEPVALGRAMRRLGAPDKLVHLMLFTLRYIDVLNAERLRLRTAMRARAFRPRSDLHTWRSLGWLIGMLLVRSMERSRRVDAAMRCRGFDGRLYAMGQDTPWTGADSRLAGLFASGLALLLCWEHCL